MNSNLKWLISTLIIVLSLNVNAQEKVEDKVCLEPNVAQFFRDAYYKGRRDSILLKNSLAREKDYLVADSVKRQQIKSYKRDSVDNHDRVVNLKLQKKTSVDSTATVSKIQLTKVKKRSGVKTWIIIGLIGAVVLER